MVTTVRPAALLLGLGLMAVALGLAVLASRPPAPKALDAPALTFSAARALALTARLLGDGAPHPTGTAANARVRARIVEELADLGYTADLQATFACRAAWATCGAVENVLARLPGRTPGPAVLLTAHYDSVAAGPGAADDMAGVATILEIARIVRAEAPLRNSIIFLLSDGEEPGLLGAEAFVAEHPWAAEVGVVLNLEARGTRGLSLLFETTEHNAWLVSTFLAQAPKPVASSLYDALYELLPSTNTDMDVYEEAGLPGLNFAFIEELAHYHTPLDALANLDPGSVQHQGDTALAAVRAFGARDLREPPAGRSVYLDVVPGLVLHWPAPWTSWLALACLLVWLGLAATLVRQGALPLSALRWGAAVLPLGVLGAALLGLALAAGLSALTGSPAPWYAHPLPARVALWAGALCTLGVVATAVARRAGFWGLALGVWLWWGLLSLLVAWWSPGMSVVFVLPAALATLVLAGAGFTPLRHAPAARELAAAVTVFGTALIWLPFALAAETGAGVELGVQAGIAVGLAVSALTPLLALPRERSRLRRWVLAGAALLTVGAAGAALSVPPYSAARPQRLNLLHFEDGHTGQSYWALDSHAGQTYSAPADVPPALRRAAGFGDEAVAVLPWSRRAYLVAPAPPPAGPRPEGRLLSDEPAGAGRVLRLQLRPPRGAQRLALYVPEDAGLTRLAVAGTPHATTEIPRRHGYQTFRCVGPACDGLTLELHLARTAPFTMYVVDSTPGLGPQGEALLRARPETAVPSGDGDVTMLAGRVAIGGP
jgi:hypothetical protein